MNDVSALRAGFNPLIRPYIVLVGAGIMACTVIGIPLALIWLCGVGQWWARHYFDRLECELDTRTLRFRKGILFQVEKTIPLENIQDVTFIEGPILKRFDLSILKFETAGQGAGNGSQMQLIGIIEAHAFRSRILKARQRLRDRQATPHAGGTDETTVVAVLGSIQTRLDRIVELLESRSSNAPGDAS